METGTKKLLTNKRGSVRWKKRDSFKSSGGENRDASNRKRFVPQQGPAGSIDGHGKVVESRAVWPAPGTASSTVRFYVFRIVLPM